MTEKDSQVNPITEETQQKPRRRSFFQISKGQMILTKDLWLQKFKSSSAHASPPEHSSPPLTSPVELPHIEQLQPINTDISSEIQFHHQQQTENSSHDIQKVTMDDSNNDECTSNSEDNHRQQQQQEVNDHKTQTEESGDNVDDIAVIDEPQHNKDRPIVKRSSILLKFLFPKKASTTSTDDAIVIDSNITESQQAELDADSDNKVNEKSDDIPARPSSPLGRRINSVLSRIPTYKEKPRFASGTVKQSSPPSDKDENVNPVAAIDEIKTKCEDEKVVSNNTNANPSLIAV